MKTFLVTMGLGMWGVMFTALSEVHFVAGGVWLIMTMMGVAWWLDEYEITKR